MTELSIRPEEIREAIERYVSSYTPETTREEVGRVIETGDGIARVEGLQATMTNELLEFHGGILGLALNLDEREIGCVILGDAQHIEEGQDVRRTGEVLSAPVGDGFLGRVVDPLGNPLDGKGEIVAEGRRILELQAPTVVQRQPVTEPLQTGIKAIDAMTPIGRGQRQLIIGDRQTGKTAVALDAIINHAAKQHYMFNGKMTVPVVFRAATGWGNQATASHSQSPEPIFAHFPGLYVACPSNAYDAKGMLKAAIRDDNPVLFTESIALYPKPSSVPDDPDFLLPIGKSDYKRRGDDVTLVGFGRGVDWALEAAAALAKEGIEAEVVDLRWLRPLDTDLVFESFKKTNHCVVVEESLPHFSIGSEIAAQIQEHMFDYMDAPVKRVTAMDVPLPFAKEIELMALPDAQKVIAAVREVLK